MRICFDLDETLCTGKHEKAVPIPGVKDLLFRLKEKGYHIIIYTARGMGSSNGNIGLAIKKVGRLTLNQLEEWGFVYDEIIFGKPSADLYVDDKAINANLMPRLEEIVELSNE